MATVRGCAIMTKDHDAAVKFYGETLGLPFVKRWGNMPGSEFQAGNLTLAVMQPDAFGFEWQPSATVIALQVTDHDRAAKFYGETLGLPFVKQWGSLPGKEYQAGNLTLAVMDPTAFGQEFHAHRVPVAFQVDDVAAARESLESQGVQFVSDMIDSGVCHQAIFSDPDGNPLALHHRYAPPKPKPGD